MCLILRLGTTRRTDRVRDGYEDATLIRLTGGGTSGGWGVGARGGDCSRLDSCSFNDVCSSFAR